MTLSEFSKWVAAIDPSATRYTQPKAVGSCTVWREYQAKPTFADGVQTANVWKVQVERYTAVENDPIANAIAAAIEGSDSIAASYQIDSNPEDGTIRHIYDCEVLC